MPKQVPELPEWMAPVIVTTAWDRWRPEDYEEGEDGEPGPADRAGVAWINLATLDGKQLRCHCCDGPTKATIDLAAIVQIGSPEDPGMAELHLICTKCGPNEFRARALAYGWLADRIERA
jgi:hypothetical protein